MTATTDLIARLRGGTMAFDWSDLPDDALIPAVPLLREAADALTAQEAELARLREAMAPILAEAKKALEYSSSSLDSIESYDDEDRDTDGGSKACKACVKINKRAIAKIEAYLAAARALSGGGK